MSKPSNEPEFLRGLLAALPYRVEVCDPRGGVIYRNREDLERPAFEASPQPLELPGVDGELVLRIGADLPPGEETRRRLLHAQRLEAIGRLTGGIAHEYNNLLGVILGYAELLDESLEEGSPEHQDLEAIQRAALRGKSLTSQLMAFSRQEILEPRRVRPAERIGELKKLLERTLGEDIRLKLHLGKTPEVHVDPSALEQVVLNLAVNAREAMARGGVLTLRTSEVQLDSPEEPLPAGTYARIEVRDTGPGIPEDELDRIFEPFFTTKEIGEGSGLGLSTVHGVISQSGGTVRVGNTSSEGTTFEILLPALEDDPDTEEALPLSSPGGVRTVLVVEDEEPLRKLICRHLQGAGYNTVAAPDAEAALEAFEAFPGRVHAVLTDVVMPGKSGVELVQELVSEHPKLRILYMTGYTDDSTLRHGLDPRRATILRKPFTRSKLLEKLAASLEPLAPKSIEDP